MRYTEVSSDVHRPGEFGTVFAFRANEMADDGDDRARPSVGVAVEDDSLARADGESCSDTLRRAGDFARYRPTAGFEGASGGLPPANGTWVDRPLDGGDAKILHSGAHLLRVPESEGSLDHTSIEEFRNR